MRNGLSTSKPMLSHKSTLFTESVIRGMTQLCNRYDAINLSQGTPGFEPPDEVKEAAINAIREGYNQYSITWGTPRFREAIARKVTAFNGIPTDPGSQRYRHLWLDGGHDVIAASDYQPRR